MIRFCTGREDPAPSGVPGRTASVPAQSTASANLQQMRESGYNFLAAREPA